MLGDHRPEPWTNGNGSSECGGPRGGEASAWGGIGVLLMVGVSGPERSRLTGRVGN